MTKDIIVAVIAFISAIAVSIITQVFTSKRHDKELSIAQTKQLAEFSQAQERRINDLKDSFNKQLSDIRVDISNVNASCQKGDEIMRLQMDELTREVRLHNGFAQRMPVVEEQIKVVNKRIDDVVSGRFQTPSQKG